MPRTYVRKKVTSYTQDDMVKAIEAVKSSEMSLYAASKQFKIPTTTLFDRMKGNCQNVGRPLAIPLGDEQRLAHAIVIMEKWGWGLSRSDILEIVAEYVKLNNLNTPFSDDVPGPDWFINFKKRHGLSIKKPQPIEYARKKMTDPFVISEYFSLLEKTLIELNLLDKPELVWNLDETSLCLDPTKTKVVGKINRPCSRTTCGTGRENITVLAAVSASGNKNTPLIVYKGKQMWDQWMAKSDEFDFEISYTTSTKGWMETTIFYNYLKDILIPSFGEERPVLLIYDGHSTHVDPSVVELAIKNKITILKLPPHSSHLLQPLDVAVFKSFKTMWDKKLVEWQRHNIGKKMPKNVFAQTFAETWQRTDAEVIKNGFKKSGIYPFNSNVIPEDIYDPAILQKFKESSTRSQSLLAENQPKSLKTLCIENINKKFNTTHSTAEKVNLKTGEQQKKVNFEELLLERVRQDKQNQPIKRKRVAKGAEVITQNILNKNKNNNHQEKPKQKKPKKSQKTKKDLTGLDKNDNELKTKNVCSPNKITSKSKLNSDNMADLDLMSNLDFNEILNMDFDLIETEWQYNKDQQEKNSKNTWIFDTGYKKEEDEERQMDILDETTGYIRTVILTRPIVETQEKTETKTEKSVTQRKNKTKKKSMKLRNWEENSTTTEESIMSVHSDDDLAEILSLTDDEENEEITKQVNDEREAMIFEQIRYLDEMENKAKLVQTENKPNKQQRNDIFKDENCKNLESHDKGRTLLDQKNEEIRKQEYMKKKENEDESILNENKENDVAYDIGDTVLVRYYIKNKWKYFIGVIIEINNNKLDKKYEVSFYKTVKTQKCLKFVKPKRADKDCTPIDLIVKQIEVIQIRENPEEFVLNDEDDKIYF